MQPRPRRALAVALIGFATFALAGCGGGTGSAARQDEGPELTATPSAQASATPGAGAKVIAVTITSDSVTPDGDRVEVKRDQPIVLEIDAAAAGELHVHSTPEQHIEFPAGKSRVTLTIDQPGVVDVEDHHLDKLIVQLEVR